MSPYTGLTTVVSLFDASETTKRLKIEITARGLTLFAEVDHAAGAAAIGEDLRPTTLLIFGNAKGGTPLMQANQTIGIDLPLKALVWQDSDGKTRITTNDPSWIATRHGLGGSVTPALGAMTALLDGLRKAAAGT